jgi:alpha-tubulin suppressor-like RCC1 family protein
MLSGGCNHSVVINRIGQIFTFGYNGYGQLGHGDTDRRHSPTVVRSLQGLQVIAVAAGQHHTMALTNDGSVFTWGIGTYGVLGHGDEKNSTVPRVIGNLSRGAALAAGAVHSLVVTADGRLHSFGCGDNGRLGHGDRRPRTSPCCVGFSGSFSIPGFRVASAAGGEAHTLAGELQFVLVAILLIMRLK